MGVNGRVIAGKHRHTPITLLFDKDTRSTKDRVREGMFSALSNDLKDCVVLDLFAGSGALGIEALSRGAKTAIFCERKKDTSNVLRRNISFVTEHTTIIENDYLVALNTITKNSIDIVFIDPPYAEDISKIIHDIYASNILAAHYILVIETEHEFTPVQNDVILKKYQYGRTHITILRGIL